MQNVVEKLPKASVLHLACHGTQDWRDPLSSGFILANGERLSIEKLMRCRLPNAHMAILSACHTASNDVEQPDEAINMSRALIFLGFSSILATKWYVTYFHFYSAAPFSTAHAYRPMNDNDGPAIAKAVYKALFNYSKVRPYPS